MSTVKIYPSKLKGDVCIPSSKSMGHREIICAGLTRGLSVVHNVSMSKDIAATLRCLRAMGVSIEEIPETTERLSLRIMGVEKLQAVTAGADCGESGSTLRFFIPLAATLDQPFTFTGRGKLVERPLQAYYDIFQEQGVSYTAENGGLPLRVQGRLQPGHYSLPGNVSSQYVTGLLLALPLLEGSSEIEITTPLESSAYVDMTLSCLRKYGIEIENVDGAHSKYLIPGGQHYQARESSVEGDWSQAAFWLVAGCLGADITCKGLAYDSLQGDMVIKELLQSMGAVLEQKPQGLRALGRGTEGITIDASNCPDIIPILTVLAAVSRGTTEIIKAGRLRFKECDRLQAISSELRKMGADIEEKPEGLLIKGKPEGLQGGVEVDAWNDHRIAMSLAVAATACREPLLLRGAESVQKSYPGFWQDFTALDGRIEVLG